MIGFLIYTASFAVMTSLLARMLYRSEFGVLVISVEYMYLLGCCLYPLLFSAGLVTPGVGGESFINNNGAPGLLAALHILVYCLSGAAGYLLSQKKPCNCLTPFAVQLNKLVRSRQLWFAALIVFGALMYGLYLYFIGLENALIYSTAMRSGLFENIEETRFLFLKTLASLSLYAVCFVYANLVRGKARLLLLSYVLLVIVAYLLSISRSLLLDFLLVPFLVYSRAHFGVTSAARIAVISVLGGLVLFFGKNFGTYMSVVLTGTGQDYALQAKAAEYGLFNGLMINVEHVWYSVEAGLVHFFENGPLFPRDLIYASLIGFVPSRVLEMIGMGAFYYGDQQSSLPLINTEIFGLPGSTVPAGWIGYSAYLSPVGGAIIFGMVKFYVYGRLEKLWRFARGSDVGLTWIPYFLFLIVSSMLSLVASNIAPASFTLFIVCFMLFIKSFTRGVLRPEGVQ
jgi:hypothetical protein